MTDENAFGVTIATGIAMHAAAPHFTPLTPVAVLTKSDWYINRSDGEAGIPTAELINSVTFPEQEVAGTVHFAAVYDFPQPGCITFVPLDEICRDCFADVGGRLNVAGLRVELLASPSGSLSPAKRLFFPSEQRIGE